MANIALIKYYARLLQKGYDKKEIPEGLLPEIEEELKKLPPREPDPEIETPEEK